MAKDSTLYIYCDESGDFGEYDERSPVYCMSLLLLSSRDDSTPYLREFHRRYHSKKGGGSPFHAGPIIRGEGPYGSLTRGERLDLFDIAFDLALKAPIKAINIWVRKNEGDVIDLLSKKLIQEIFSHIKYFKSFDRIVFVYDNGQIPLKTMLTGIFNAYFLNFQMVLGLQSEQPFLQMADLIVTLTLLDYKVRESHLTHSEDVFFGGRRMLKKTYLGLLKKRNFDTGLKGILSQKGFPNIGKAKDNDQWRCQ